MKPINDNLILEPSSSNTRGILYIPDNWSDATTACKVVSVGHKVHPVIKPGDIVLCQTGFAGRVTNKVGRTENFWCKEKNLYAIVKNNIILPIGLNVLIRRDIQDTKEGVLEIPSPFRTQSLTGTVVRYGLSRLPSKVNGITQGLQVRLTEWQDWMLQIELEDGSEGLIVKEQDLLYSYEKNQHSI